MEANVTNTTESLERSLQNCSLKNNNMNLRSAVSLSSSSNINNNSNHHHHEDEEIHKPTTTLLELNSHISLPYQWEQCLDLKTGEIYFINWSNGMKARQDPRKTIANNCIVDSDSGSDGDDCSYDSEEEEEEESSSSESSQSTCSTNRQQHQPCSTNYYRVTRVKEEEQVLVVAGCKSCFMYFMVPKLAADCPKCSGQLLHFDTSQNSSTTTS